MDHYNSLNILNSARSFLEASRILHNAKPGAFAPTYFLVCQSVELSLKAYLRGLGYTDKRLRNICHNLEECLKEAEKEHLKNYVSLSDEDVWAVRQINPYYDGKDLQYMKSGYKSYPLPEALINIAARLVDGLNQFCIDKRETHAGKASAV